MKKILFIDDDKEFIDNFRQQLAGTEFEVEEITEGVIERGKKPDTDSIIEQTVKIDPDYIFVDLDLVGDQNCESGLRVLRKLCSHPKLKEKWISVLSVNVASAEYGTVQMRNHLDVSRSYGAKEVIHKEDLRRNNQYDAQLLLAYLPGVKERLPHVMIFEDQERVIQEYRNIFRGKAILMLQGLPKWNEELINTILRFDPVLIIMDLKLEATAELKEHQGLRLIKEIRQCTRLSKMGIVVCSKYVSPLPGDTRDSETENALKAGADAAFSKVVFPTAEQFLNYAKRSPK